MGASLWHKWLGWIGLVCLLLMSTTLTWAQKSSLTFRFESEYDEKISVVLYSSDRKGYQWPEPGRVYVLRPGTEADFKIGCLGGEKICYGAWVTEEQSTYWGVGRNRHGCKKCCFTCDGGSTPLIGLE
jgi:hypothetical protein